jgi:hypothetical protein
MICMFYDIPHSIRRPLRGFTKLDFTDLPGVSGGGGGGLGGNTLKEPVVELISRKNFTSIVLTMNPTISDREVLTTTVLKRSVTFLL